MKNRQRIYEETGLLLLIDQFIKYMITNHMKLYDSITIIPKFFKIFYIRNTGAAFSILENQRILLMMISVIMIILIDRFLKKEKNLKSIYIIPFGMIMGGIFGNLMDRILYHEVIDYLSFSIHKYSFPVFNFADMMITIGMIILIWFTIREEKKEKKSL